MLSNSLFGRKNSTSSTYSKSVKLNKKNHQPRHVAFEPLESRDLLTVTTGAIDDAAYDEIRAAYPDFNLPELQADLNVITIKPNAGALSLSDLQEAIYAAGESSSPDLILVQTSAAANSITYTSAADELAIDIDSDSVTIIGWGSDNLTLDANQQSRVMIISESSTVNLGGLSITGGNSSASLMYSDTYSAYAGGIGSLGTLTISACTVTDNTAIDYGGGIASSGALTIIDSLISGNKTTGTEDYASGGGGIASSGTVTIINSEISSNESYNGSGILSSGTVTITDSVISENKSHTEFTYGGGIASSGTLTIASSVISYNEAGYGGGIYNGENSSVTIADSEIVGNTGDDVGGGIMSLGTLVITDSGISGNKAEYSGGGIFSSDGPISIKNSSVEGNSAMNGGGIYSFGPLSAMYSTISDNSSDYQGGGIYISCYNNVSQIINCTVSGNSSDEGAGVYIDEGTVMVENSAFTGNNAISSGGGIYCLPGNDIDITNSLFAGNSASQGGGIYTEGYTSLFNCTIAGNTALSASGIFSSMEMFAVNSIVSLNYSDNISGEFYSNENNLIDDEDPGFVCSPVFDSNGELVNADSLDLHLSSGSKAIDSGDSEMIDFNALDLDGNWRKFNGAVDIGAYETQGTLGDKPYSNVVTTLDDSFILDDDEWSLREAIYYAPGYETITFADNLTGTLYLSDGQLIINKGLVIDGDDRITIDANHDSRIFYVSAGTEDEPVVLDGLTIQNGYADQGAGILNESNSSLIIANCTISGNEAYDDGGAIYNYYSSLKTINTVISNNRTVSFHGGAMFNDHGEVFILDSEISGNYAAEVGGGLYNFNGSFTITDSEITGNTSEYQAGGLHNYQGTYVINSSKISENKVFYVSGGGIFNEIGNVTITNSVISKNSSTNNGGGIYNCDSLTVTESSVTSNSANNGGGIYIESGELAVTDSTISGNTAMYSGGGIYINSGTASVTKSAVSKNDGGYTGGGLYVSEEAKLTFVSGSIEENTSQQGGGAFSIGESTVADSLIINNSSEVGGAFFVQSNMTVTNSVVANNSANNSGGGFFNDGGTLTLTNCTISGNSNMESEYGEGYGIYNYSTLIANNTIILDSIYFDSDWGGSMSGSNNLSNFSDWNPGSNNIDYDSSQPLFIDAENGDFHLIEGSQAVDAGDNALAVDANGAALAYDLDGARRITNVTVDIGAYEFDINSPILGKPVFNTPTIVDNTVTVSWSNVNNASGYLFEYKLSSDADWTSEVVSGLSYSLDLSAGQTYKVRVKALGGGDYTDSAYSAEKLILDYNSIREKYSEFDLPESEDDINLIVVDLTAGDNLAKLKKAIQKAGSTEQDDLIVVLTSEDANTLKFSNGMDMLMFDVYAEEYGSVTIVSLGDSNLTIDADKLCSVMSVGSENVVKLGGLTITNGSTYYSDGSGISNYGNLTFSNCTITGNYTEACGAIYNDSYGSLIITNSLISDNVSETSGGGIYNLGFALVTNSVISANASNVGGGICNVSELTIINCTIAGNSAEEGAGIYNSGTSLYADNSIIVDDIVNSSGEIAGNNNLTAFTQWAYGDDNLVCDPSMPLFVDAENGDYHLAAGSQATDNGNNDLALDLNGNALEFDLDGAARIVNGTVDIGAYEYQGEPIEYSTVVNTLNDSFDLNDDEWSLREAIYFAPDYVTITFADDLFADGPQTITLTQGELAIRKALVIDGDGLITIDANQASRVFNVTAGTEEQPVVLDGLTIQNGYTEELGGGILVTDGYLVVDTCLITENSAMLGGGIATDSFESISQLVIKNSTVSHNTSENSGGGIYSYGSLTIIDSSISDNTTRGDYCDGGGIGYFINDPIVEATFTITNSSITGNTAYSGGGIRYASNSDSNATFFTITDSVISGNSAKSGGGISCESAVLTITNCDISDNASDSGVGGGIAKFDGTLTVTNSTIVGNKAIEGSGGGICSYDAVVTITDSMITGNMALVGGGINTESGAVTVVDSLISENESEESGGGISSGYGSVTIINSAISGNAGGGVYCFDNTLTIIDSKIINNASGVGAGIQIEDGGNISIVNSLIADNIAESRGGAIYNHYGNLSITNSTIAGNKVTCECDYTDDYSEGGGIYNWGTVTFNSYNSIIACNTYCDEISDIYTSTVDSEGAVVNGYNSLSSFTAWDNAADSVNWVYDSTMPLFFNAEKGNYRLAEESQAIDKGDNQWAYDAGLDELSKDLARKPRFVGDAIDIGAYEFNASNPIDFVGTVTTKINAYNDTNTIPDSVAQLTDWDQFYLELWAPDVSEFAPGDTFDAAVNYNPKYHQLDTAQTISTPDGVSAEIADQTIEGDGSVTIYITVTVSDSGYTAPGSNTYWGSVLFTPSTAQGAGVDDPFAQESLGISVDGVETETTLIAMPFDLDNDNTVDVDDFVAFAQVYGCRPGSFDIDDPRYAKTRQADFDNSGIVDVSDFVSFATNYGLKKGQGSNVQLPQQANALPGAPAQPVSNEFVVEEQTAVQTPASTLQVETVEIVVTQEASPDYLTLAQPAQVESVQTLHLAHSSALLDLFDNQNKPDAAVELSAPAIDNVLFDCDEFDFLFDDSDLDADDASDSSVDLSVVLDELELEFA